MISDSGSYLSLLMKPRVYFVVMEEQGTAGIINRLLFDSLLGNFLALLPGFLVELGDIPFTITYPGKLTYLSFLIDYITDCIRKCWMFKSIQGYISDSPFSRFGFSFRLVVYILSKTIHFSSIERKV